MLILNILSALLLIIFVGFVWFSTSKKEPISFSLFTNKNNYKIKRKNFLSNIIYLDDDNRPTYGF